MTEKYFSIIIKNKENMFSFHVHYVKLKVWFALETKQNSSS